jgi:hypothetical protein
METSEQRSLKTVAAYGMTNCKRNEDTREEMETADTNTIIYKTIT